MDIFVQWATILSPIIAVLIACITCFLTSKDTKKQIKAVEAQSLLQIDTNIELLLLECYKINGECKRLEEEIKAKKNDKTLKKTLFMNQIVELTDNDTTVLEAELKANRNYHDYLNKRISALRDMKENLKR